jgi:hypothetical protein
VVIGVIGVIRVVKVIWAIRIIRVRLWLIVFHRDPALDPYPPARRIAVGHLPFTPL